MRVGVAGAAAAVAVTGLGVAGAAVKVWRGPWPDHGDLLVLERRGAWNGFLGQGWRVAHTGSCDLTLCLPLDVRVTQAADALLLEWMRPCEGDTPQAGLGRTRN